MSCANEATFAASALAFDQVAVAYDKLFTYTALGWAQRQQVWRSLDVVFPTGSRILELNCGTGVDARFLARGGRSVLACDASPQMLAVARRHRSVREPAVDLEFLQLANEQLQGLEGEARFDGAFSNFSGVNCVADLAAMAESLARLVRPGGRALLCLWGRFCVGEIAWYLLHGKTRKAFRRFFSRVSAQLGGVEFPVYYHSVKETVRAFAPWFRLRSRHAIGLFVPPSYAERSIAGCPPILAILESMDRLFAGWPLLRGAGDHVLLEFERCNR